MTVVATGVATVVATATRKPREANRDRNRSRTRGGQSADGAAAPVAVASAAPVGRGRRGCRAHRRPPQPQPASPSRRLGWLRRLGARHHVGELTPRSSRSSRCEERGTSDEPRDLRSRTTSARGDLDLTGSRGPVLVPRSRHLDHRSASRSPQATTTTVLPSGANSHSALASGVACRMQPWDCGVPSWAIVCTRSPSSTGIEWKPIAAPVSPLGEPHEPLHRAGVVDADGVLAAAPHLEGAGVEVVGEAAGDEVGAPDLAVVVDQPDPLPALAEDHAAALAGVGRQRLVLHGRSAVVGLGAVGLDGAVGLGAGVDRGSSVTPCVGASDAPSEARRRARSGTTGSSPARRPRPTRSSARSPGRRRRWRRRPPRRGRPGRRRRRRRQHADAAEQGDGGGGERDAQHDDPAVRVW